MQMSYPLYDFVLNCIIDLHVGLNLKMILQTIDKLKLVISSRKLVDDNKKVNGVWTKTGNQSYMYSGTFLDEFNNEYRFYSKEDLFSPYANQEVLLQLKLEQFGVKAPTCKIYAVVPSPVKDSQKKSS